MNRKLPIIFFFLSLLAFVLIVTALWQASTPSWKVYQREYLQLEAQGEPNQASKAAVLTTPLQINQIILPGLHRVDRCTTCHLGIEDPTMKNAPEPFRYHPGLGPHTPSKFGCTICHGGQGLATDVKDAHGNVRFWSKPLLPADYVDASCGQCHKEGNIPGVPELTEGRRLFETEGCHGCHKLDGVGGSIGPDLSEEGASQRSPQWLEAHFLDPSRVSPGTPMPNFHFTREQARALTYFMLSLTNQEMGTYYASEPLIPSPQYGQKLFVQKNCLVCHSIGNVGGKVGPDLLGVTKRHSSEWLDEQLYNPQLVYPGSVMPAYDMAKNDRQALIAFLAAATPNDAKEILANKGRAPTPEDAAIAAGQADFSRFGCAGCHGTELQGGVPNPNAQGGEVPSLLHLSTDYTQDDVVDIIRNGRTPPLANVKGPTPPLYMPSWKHMLSNEDIHNLVAFLWSKQPKSTGGW